MYIINIWKLIVFLPCQVIHPVQSDLYVFALCKDHKIRMWLASSYDCVMVADVLNMAGGGEGAAGHSGTSRTLLHQVNILSFSPKKLN